MNFQLYLLGLAGILVHYLTRWKEIQDKQEKVTLISELPGFLIALITTFVLILVKDDYATVFAVTKLGAFMLGYTCQSVWNKIVTMKFGSILPGQQTAPAGPIATADVGSKDHPDGPDNKGNP